VAAPRRSATSSDTTNDACGKYSLPLGSRSWRILAGTAADDTPEELYGLWRRAVEHSRAAMDKALADGGLDQPARYTTSDSGTSPNLRHILVDLHDEYARHVGHADLLREAVDGLVGEDPPQSPRPA
jgi:hypothetical protein